jgi:putative ABC transport system permease protein
MAHAVETPRRPALEAPEIGRGPAWLLGLRDLQRRRRRFAIGVVAAALVLALTIMQTGIRASFDNEIDRTVDGFAADLWLRASGTLGPFNGSSAFPNARLGEVRRLPGVRRAEPVAVLTALAKTPEEQMVNLIGVVPGGAGRESGQAPGILARGGAVVDDGLGISAGDTMTLNGRRVRVDATVDGRSFYAGVPSVYVALPVAQQLSMNGRKLATGVVVQGTIDRRPPGLTVVRNEQVKEDLGRTVEQARGTISLIRTLLWIVAAGIIGAVVYLSAVERVRDFAVLKAIGVSTRALMIGLAMQSALLALAAVLLGMLLALVLAPASPMAVEVPTSTYLTMPLGALVVGMLASAAAVRRAIRTDPALAFGT